MKFVFASERQKLIRERKNYLDNYNKQLSEHRAQRAAYEEAASNYSSDMEAYIKTLLESDMVALPEGIQISVKQSDYRRDEYAYYIVVRYISNKSKYDDPKYRYSNSGRDINSGRVRGFNWKFTSYLQVKEQKDEETGEVKNVTTVETSTNISADLLETDDIEALKVTYDVFSKLKSINWDDVLMKINTGIPVEENFITTENPGHIDTSKWDDAITAYNLSRTMGKDLWVKVIINREDSYDRYNSNNPGVDGRGWINLVSATDKFYTFYWLECRYNDSDSFSLAQIQSATRRTVKLKKIYISVMEPVEYLTTAELTSTPIPSLKDLEENDNED